jgi:hypothetical protein
MFVSGSLISASVLRMKLTVGASSGQTAPTGEPSEFIESTQ